jgi:hypothetical protein
MNGYGAYSGRYTLHFDYELERGDETLGSRGDLRDRWR